MAQSTAFGGVGSGNIVEVRFRKGSILTKNAGIVTLDSVMEAGPEGLDVDAKKNILYTNITKGIPDYDGDFDGGDDAELNFASMCAAFDGYLRNIGPIGFVRNGIGYVARSGAALSTAKDGKGNDVSMLLHDITPDCVDDVKVYRGGRKGTKKSEVNGMPVEIGLGTESILTKKYGVMKLSKMLFPKYDGGYRDVNEEKKRKVLEIAMTKGDKYAAVKEVEGILGPFPRYFWFVRNAEPLCYVGNAVGFGGEKDYGSDGEIVLSNMYLRGKEIFTKPGSFYAVSRGCIKSIRLLE